jgi:predicted transcriptional regulator
MTPRYEDFAMPDDAASTPVSLRVPASLLETLDRIATTLDRPRSWVMLRALRLYLADEGQEVLDVQEGLAEAERGEIVDAEKVLGGIDEIIAAADPQHGPR